MTTKENIIETLKSNKLKLAKFCIRSVGLFGSYIRGEQSSESDIDLLIDFEAEKENNASYIFFDRKYRKINSWVGNPRIAIRRIEVYFNYFSKHLLHTFYRAN